MAKTRRKKFNTQPRTMFGSHVSVVVLQPGSRGEIKGVRTRKVNGVVPPTMAATGKRARATTIGMVITGIAKGKRYPYRSVKRGGAAPAEKLSLVQRVGRKVKRVLVGGNAAA